MAADLEEALSKNKLRRYRLAIDAVCMAAKSRFGHNAHRIFSVAAISRPESI